MKFWSLLVLWIAPALASAQIPDQVFLRHARDLIPRFVAQQAEVFRAPLVLDVDSLRVAEDAMIPPVLTGLAPFEYAAMVFALPLPATTRCRRIDGDFETPRGRATFFVRAQPSHFELARTCIADENRPPLLLLERAGETLPGLSDGEIVALAKPLVSQLVRAQAAAAPVDSDSFTLAASWFAPRLEFQDPRGLLGGPPGFECRNLRFEMPVTHQRGTTAVSITYDTDELLPRIPLEYQTVSRDGRRLRLIRVALVRGCGFWNRRKAPELGMKPARQP